MSAVAHEMLNVCPVCGSSYPKRVTTCPRDGTPLVSQRTPGVPPVRKSTPAPALAPTDETMPPHAPGPDKVPKRRARPSAVQEPGTVLGSYRLLSLIGKGGMGEVYRAKHITLGREVAVKLLRQRFATDREAVRRFFREARAVNKIKHPNIVEITDLVEADDGRSYFIMELLEGQPLDARIDERRLSLAEVLDIALQICDGLAAMHEAGIVHRDLKPNNIFLSRVVGSERWRVKLLDFGLVKLTESARLADARQSGVSSGGLTTSPDMVLGTPEYMSPEQIRDVESIDHRADIYALGVVLYEMLTGKRPIVAPTLGDLLVKVVTEQPAPLAQVLDDENEVPQRLQALVMKCLLKRRDARPQTAAEIRAELDVIDEAEAVPLVVETRPAPAAAEPAAAIDAAIDQTERLPAITGSPKPRLALPLALAALAVVGIVAAVVFAARNDQPAEAGNTRSAIRTRRRGKPIAKLAQLWRDVHHRERGSKAWRPAERGVALYDQDAVRTGSGARAQVRFDQGGRLEIDERSIVIIELPDGAGPEGRTARVAKGTLRVTTKPGAPLRLITPDGKTAKIEATGDGPATVRVRRGAGGKLEVAVIKGDAKLAVGGTSQQLRTNQLVDIKGGQAGKASALLRFPQLISPGVDVTLARDRAVLLRWSAVEGAVRYRVQLSTFLGFDEKLVDKIVDGNTLSLPPTLAAARHVWRVSSIDAVGHESEFGFARRFTISGAAAAKAEVSIGEVVAPRDNVVVQRIRGKLRVVFRWSGPHDARYDLVIARRRSLARPMLRRRALRGSAIAITVLQPGVYYWGVFQRSPKSKRSALLGAARRLVVVERQRPEVHLPKIEWK